MRALRLDYCAAAQRGTAGKILLAAGVLAIATVLFEYRAVEEELAAQEARTAEIRKAGKRSVARPRANPREIEASAQEYKAAQLALQRLSLRWDELFTALEGTRAQGVALLSIEPDPGKSIVKLTAEAKSAQDMLNYVEGLQAAGGLTDVALASHQVKQSDPLRPMRFVVLASWMK